MGRLADVVVCRKQRRRTRKWSPSHKHQLQAICPRVAREHSLHRRRGRNVGSIKWDDAFRDPSRTLVIISFIQHLLERALPHGILLCHTVTDYLTKTVVLPSPHIPKLVNIQNVCQKINPHAVKEASEPTHSQFVLLAHGDMVTVNMCTSMIETRFYSRGHHHTEPFTESTL